MNTIEVEISHGKIRGFREEGVNIFKGIPYAGQVLETGGFAGLPNSSPGQVSEMLCSWAHLQFNLPGKRTEPAEDCLFLNIWTPANDNQKRPVMFYNHGGGFVIGSGGKPDQDGANLARNFDVVVVQTNHRLGLLGFLFLDDLAGPDYEGSGNQGLLDIIAGVEMGEQEYLRFWRRPRQRHDLR